MSGGLKVFDVIEATPDRLREVDGIGPVRAASILAAWAEQKAVREIMVFLHSHDPYRKPEPAGVTIHYNLRRFGADESAVSP